MRLPVAKILWGMFAFPILYPARMGRAASLPLLAIIALSLVWISQPSERLPSVTTWMLLLLDWLLYAWLAVRIHRVVLVGHDGSEATNYPGVVNYFGALVLGNLILSVFFAIVSVRYVPTEVGAAEGEKFVGLPEWVTWLLELAPLYLLARLSPMLPGFALGRGWQPGAAWRQSAGNGWRLVAVVLLLPWLFGEVVDAGVGPDTPTELAGVLAVINTLLRALGIIALSLSFHELSATPGPPPTAPPA